MKPFFIHLLINVFLFASLRNVVVKSKTLSNIVLDGKFETPVVNGLYIAYFQSVVQLLTTYLTKEDILPRLP